MATNTGGVTGKRLFGSMGLAGLWCVARDALGWMPTLVAQLPIPGVSFAIYNSPQMLSVGFLVGGFAVAFWFLGALVGQLRHHHGRERRRPLGRGNGAGHRLSLGMGLMMGSGVGVVLKDILPHAAHVLRGRRSVGETAVTSGWSRLERGTLALMVAAAALLVCIGLGLGPIVAVVVVLLAFVTTIMSAQSVGQTGIDPMEIFGLIVLLAVAAFSDASQVQLFYVAGVVAVACGLAGDVMSDFKTGAIIGTSPRAMWMGQAIGALLGTVVAVAVLVTLFSAYGPGAFGSGQMFVLRTGGAWWQRWSPASRASRVLWSGFWAALRSIGGTAGDDVWPGRLSAVLYVAHRCAWRRRAVGLRAHLQGARRCRLSRRRAWSWRPAVLGGESIVGVVIALASVVSGLAA